MARLTARIVRLEKIRYGARKSEFSHLSEDELDARMCQVVERLTAELRDRGQSVADLEAEVGRPISERFAAALTIELAAPAFDAARCLATLNGVPAGLAADTPDAPHP